MQALILAGGEGTRLRPLTLTRPKPAIQLVDRPFIRHMVDWVVRHGVDEVVIASGFGADVLREAIGGDDDSSTRVRYVREPDPLGTAGPLRLAADEGILDERFLVLNGDVLADLDLGALMRAHEEADAVATLALYPVEDPGAYGLVRRGGGPEAPGAKAGTPGGPVIGFLEKPEHDQIDTDEISAGAYVIDRRVVELIPRGRMVSIEREIFPRLVGQGLYGHRLEGYWMDIGTPERYLQASWDILEGRVRDEAAARLDRDGLLVEDAAQVDDTATVRPPALLQSEVDVGAGATVGPRAVIGSRSEIGERAEVSTSVLMSGCRIGSNAQVHEAILAPGVEVGEGARLGAGSVVGEGARIEAGARIPDGALIPPGEVVS
jgi:mannose-1-phosphate guanylyltransferase